MTEVMLNSFAIIILGFSSIFHIWLTEKRINKLEKTIKFLNREMIVNQQFTNNLVETLKENLDQLIEI